MTTLEVKYDKGFEKPVPHVNDSGTWKVPRKVYINLGTSGWVTAFEPVPSNAIVFYLSTGDVPADASVYTNLTNRFPYGTGTGSPDPSDPEGTIGSDTQSGSDHGSGTTTYNAKTNPKERRHRALGPSGYYCINSSHTHSMAHTHTPSAYIIPEYVGLIPTMGAKLINQNAAILHDTQITDDLFEELTSYVNRYIRGIASQTMTTTGGDSGHDHGVLTGQTSGYSGSLEKRSYLRSALTIWHHHTASSTNGYALNEPPYFSVRLYRTTRLGSWSDLPSGTVCFITDTVIPEGWSYYDRGYSRIPRIRDNYETGGSSNHTHTSDSDGSTITSPIEHQYEGEYGSDWYWVPTYHHSRNATGSHTGTGNSIPASLKLVPIIKD